MEDISNKIDNMIFNMQEEYIERYWKYYLVLEKDFLSTESYLAIDKDNSEGYSDIFMKLLNAICSEVDVVFKYLCKLYQTIQQEIILNNIVK